MSIACMEMSSATSNDPVLRIEYVNARLVSVGSSDASTAAVALSLSTVVKPFSIGERLSATSTMISIG